jgi:transposase
MAWKVTAMDVRMAAALEQGVDDVAGFCRAQGISRQTYYKWRKRFEREGLDGLRDRSRRPKSCPHQTPVDVVGKILYLRQNYHFGPAKISMYLQRYHEVEVSPASIWRILKRLDLNRLPASQRYNVWTNAGSGTRSNNLATASRSTSSSSSP